MPLNIFEMHQIIKQNDQVLWKAQAKMLIQGKPIKSGYRFWWLCNFDRYLFNFGHLKVSDVKVKVKIFGARGL